jgi:predicted SnoaL-like aldol condensation-catalyzing enzyme
MKTSHLMLCAVLALAAPLLPAQEPPAGVKDQLALLKSSDPKLAANKKLVFDMYRTILQGGHADKVEQFFTPGYIQHNPNVTSSRDSLAKYITQTRPKREIKPTLDFPLISLVAEGDMVVISLVSFQDDPENPGKRYANTHFDMFRIENGKIAEHWDHVAKSKAALHFDPNVETKEKKPAK